MSAALRRLRWFDVEALVPLEVELFGAGAWSAETFWSELAAPGRTYLLAPGGAGEPLGYAGLACARGGDADVQTLAVAPAARGRGLGRALLRALLERARQQQATSVVLEVRADNDVALGLYASEGFERLSVRRRYYPGDVDAVVMRRRPA